MDLETRLFAALQKFDGHITNGSFAEALKMLRAGQAANENLTDCWPIIYVPKWKAKNGCQ